MALVSNSFLFLLVRHLLLEAMHLFLVASLLLVVRPGATNSVLVASSDALAPSSFLFINIDLSEGAQLVIGDAGNSSAECFDRSLDNHCT